MSKGTKKDYEKFLKDVKQIKLKEKEQEKVLLFQYNVDSKKYPTKGPPNVFNTQMPIYSSDRDRLMTGAERTSPQKYFNDTLLHLYISRWMELNNLLGEESSLVVHSSAFYTKLVEHGDDKNYDESYKRVINWQKRFDPFGQYGIMIPINAGLHWSLAYVERPNSLLLLCSSASSSCKIWLLDPLGSYHEVEVIGRYLKQHLLSTWLDVRNEGRSVLFNEGTMRAAIASIPVKRVSVGEQQNNHDCGTYVCLYFKQMVTAYAAAKSCGR